jgi:hypothetical protein
MQVVPFEQEDLRRAIDIIDKYADLPADFADATLVAVAERLEIRDIVTFDSDFDIYLFGDNYFSPLATIRIPRYEFLAFDSAVVDLPLALAFSTR